MQGNITRIVHRHGDQRERDPDLVLEVGKPVPSFYQAGRPRGCVVLGISGSDPFVCTLDAGDPILIGKRSVLDVTRPTDA